MARISALFPAVLLLVAVTATASESSIRGAAASVVGSEAGSEGEEGPSSQWPESSPGHASVSHTTGSPKDQVVAGRKGIGGFLGGPALIKHIADRAAERYGTKKSTEGTGSTAARFATKRGAAVAAAASKDPVHIANVATGNHHIAYVPERDLITSKAGLGAGASGINLPAEGTAFKAVRSSLVARGESGAAGAAGADVDPAQRDPGCMKVKVATAGSNSTEGKPCTDDEAGSSGSSGASGAAKATKTGEVDPIPPVIVKALSGNNTKADVVESAPATIVKSVKEAALKSPCKLGQDCHTGVPAAGGKEGVQEAAAQVRFRETRVKATKATKAATAMKVHARRGEPQVQDTRVPNYLGTSWAAGKGPVPPKYPGPEEFYGHNAEPLKAREWTRRTPTQSPPGWDPPAHVEWDPVFRGALHPIGFTKVKGCFKKRQGGLMREFVQ